MTCDDPNPAATFISRYAVVHSNSSFNSVPFWSQLCAFTYFLKGYD